MKILRCLTLPLLLPAIAGAVQFTNEPFSTDPGEYVVGSNNLVGQGPSITGYEGNWLEAFGGSESPDVISTSLEYPGTLSSGGAVRYTGGGGGRCGRILSQGYNNDSVGTVYVGVLVQLDAIGADYRAFELHEGGFDDGANRRLQIAVGESVGDTVAASDFAVRINETTGASLGAMDTDVNLFVIRIDFANTPLGDTVTIYRNPTDLTNEANNTPAATIAGIDFRFDRTSFARFNASSGIAFDEVRAVTTFNDVTGTIDPDGDDDGMDDGWEEIHNVDDPAADPDKDGLTNLEEFDEDTDPNMKDTDSDNIDDKQEVDGSGNAFDGLRTEPNDPDSDDDDLTDGEEVSGANGFITNPNSADTDGDGEDDGTEIAEGTDPLDPSKNSAALGRFLIDGTRDSLYGAPLAVQTAQTGFGDNQNELDAAYAATKDGKLYLLLTGNIQTNFNKLEILIDSASGGSSVFTSAGNDNAANMNGMTFDDAFTPEYHLIARRGGDKFDLDFADLTAMQFASYISVFGDDPEGAATTGAPTNSTFATDPSPIRIAYDDSNMAGIGGAQGSPADQVAAAAVTTGLELCIDLADLGTPISDIRISAFFNNSEHSFLSNQFLGGLPGNAINLTAPNGINLNTQAGDQFFTVPVSPAPVQITHISASVDTQEVSLTFESIPNTDYLIEFSNDLTSWEELDDGFPSTGTSTTYSTAQAIPGRVFFRVSVAL